MTNNLAAALEGLERLITTSSRDWGTYRVDAWLYAVLVGWDCEETEHDETCVHGALEEMAARHGWDADAVAKARRYRAAVRAAVSAAVAPPTTHGLSLPHADALYDAIATPGPGERESFDDQHARVCRVVREILDDLLPAPAEPADQTALRNRIADTLATADGWVFAPGFKAESPTYRGFLRQADAVLAVLPEPADTAAVLADVERAIRAATGSCGYKAEDGCDFCNGVDAALDQLRRMADETATETPAVTVHAAPDLSPAAEEALDALIDVAKQQAVCDFEHPHPEHPCGRRTAAGTRTPAAGARQDGAQP